MVDKNQQPSEGDQGAGAEAQNAGQESGTGQERPDPKDVNIEDILNFDPFDEGGQGDSAGQGAGGEPSEGAESGQQGEGQQSESTASGEEGQPGEGQQAAEQPGSQAGGASDEVKAELAQLRELVQQQSQTIQQLQTQGQAPQGQQPSGGQQDSGEMSQEEVQRIAQSYAIQVPDQLLQTIQSDDPATARQGIQQLIQGIGTTVHKNVIQEARQLFQQELHEQVPHMLQMQQGQQSERQRIYQDFYGNYPQLDKPELRGLVQSTAQQVFQETGAQQWSQAVRDMIAQRVVKTLEAGAGGGQGQGQQGQGQQGGGQGKSNGQFTSGGSSPRGPAGPQDPNSERGIADTLFG